ncbi:hypothetical protein PTI98_000562 [Pleurotus ostreatus]|nr:hypothetical protein PTI98_000562 [Pleurotus ostreatus]
MDTRRSHITEVSSGLVIAIDGGPALVMDDWDLLAAIYSMLIITTTNSIERITLIVQLDSSLKLGFRSNMGGTLVCHKSSPEPTSNVFQCPRGDVPSRYVKQYTERAFF